MLLLPGSSSLTPPRFAALSRAMADVNSALSLEDAFHIYAVVCRGPVDETALAKLLQPGTSEPAREILPREGTYRLVVPRPGTL